MSPRRAIRRPLERLRRVGADREGAAFVEFALIAPVMITMLFGLAELGNALVAGRRCEHAAADMGDLVARLSDMSDAQETEVFAAASDLLVTTPTSPLQLQISHATMNSSGSAIVDWSDTKNWSGTTYKACATIPLTQGSQNGYSSGTTPALALSSGDHVIISTIVYTYTSPLAKIIKTPLTFKYTSFLSPRLGSTTRDSATLPTASSPCKAS